MDEVWGKLQAMSIHINADQSPREADRSNAKKLSDGYVEGNWKAFYEALGALERGCGYSDYRMLAELCRTASLQDDRHLLQVIEQKTKLFDIVLFLRSVEPITKLAWIDGNSFTKTFALFECLRQMLTDSSYSRSYLDTVVKGLLGLAQMSSEHFRYLLSHNILYRENMISITSKLLESLPENGWAVLSQCVTFDSVTPNQMKFWNQCASKLDWNIVHRRAAPLLDAWGSYMAQSFSGHYRQSLYCDVSNMLIPILIYKLDTVKQYLYVMEQTLCTGETAMYRWYERETQQFGALIACLSIIEHLHYVWINNSAAYNEPFPEKLSSSCLFLINQWRYLWVSCGEKTIKEEINRLESWLKGVSSA